jgi:hypothetical protein
LAGLTSVTSSAITDSGLTSGRVTYATTGGLLTDSANLTFNGTTLTANTIGAFTLGGTVAGGGNQLNNVVIGASTPLAGSFTTLSASSSLIMSTSGAGAQGGSVTNTNAAAGAWASWGISNGTRSLKLATLSTGWSGTFLTGGPTTEQSAIYTDGNIPIVFGINSSMVGQFTSTGLNSTAIGATTPSTGAFTTLSATTTITQGSGASGLILQSHPSVYGAIYSTNVTPSYSNYTLVTNGSFLQLNGSGNVNLMVANSSIANATSTGLAVTGTLSATGVTYSSAGTQVGGSGGVTWATGTQYIDTIGILGSSGSSLNQTAGIQFGDNYGGGSRQWAIYNGRNATTTAVGTLNFMVSSGTNIDAMSGTGTTVASLSSTGLAVTGTIIASTSVGVGNTTPSGGGAGIAFPATQSASSDANTLDDYEEGTWTPSVGGTATYTQQQGSYIKVGRLVTVSFDMAILLLGTGSTSGISGLPFTVGSATSPKQEQCVGSSGYVLSLAVNVYSLNFYAAANGAVIYSISMNTLGGTSNVNPAIYGNGTRVQGTVTYMATN